MSLIEKVAEEAILFALPTIKHNHYNSKMSGLQRKVRKLIKQQYLQSITQLTDADYATTIDKLNKWMKVTKWGKTPKSLSTIISFLGILIDESNFNYNSDLHDTIVEIADHLNEGNKYYHVSLQAGQIAKDKWDKIFKEV